VTFTIVAHAAGGQPGIPQFTYFAGPNDPPWTPIDRNAPGRLTLLLAPGDVVRFPPYCEPAAAAEGASGLAYTVGNPVPSAARSCCPTRARRSSPP